MEILYCCTYGVDNLTVPVYTPQWNEVGLDEDLNVQPRH